MNALIDAARRRPLPVVLGACAALAGAIAYAALPDAAPAAGPAGAPPAVMTDPRAEEAAVRRFVRARSVQAKSPQPARAAAAPQRPAAREPRR